MVAVLSPRPWPRRWVIKKGALGLRPCLRSPPSGTSGSRHSHNLSRGQPHAGVWGSPSAEPGSMIVDKLLDDSRGGEGLLDAAGDGSLMTSPLNLAYFYSASPPAAAPGACDAGCSASGPSAPGSPGSDSSDFSVSSASSCGAVETRPRGGARAERLPGTHRPGSGGPSTQSTLVRPTHLREGRVRPPRFEVSGPGARWLLRFL